MLLPATCRGEPVHEMSPPMASSRSGGCSTPPVVSDEEHATCDISQHLLLLRRRHPQMDQHRLERVHTDESLAEEVSRSPVQQRAATAWQPSRVFEAPEEPTMARAASEGGPDGEVVSALLEALMCPEDCHLKERQQCPHCRRNFSAEAAVRHLPICQQANTRKRIGGELPCLNYPTPRRVNVDTLARAGCSVLVGTPRLKEGLPRRCPWPR